jgi:hypothetical protein
VVKFAIRLIPATILGATLAIYRGHFEGLDRSGEWVLHTHEARHQAELVIRQAGCTPNPAALARTVEMFAHTTEDNPSQVARVAAMRRAMATGDLGTVARLGDEAEAEEVRLLEIRSAAEVRKLEQTRGLADLVFGVGLAMLVLQEVLRRLTEARAAKEGPAPTPKATEDDHDSDERSVRIANIVNDLRARLSVYEARYDRDRSQTEIMEAIRLLQGQLDATQPEGRPEDGDRDRG